MITKEQLKELLDYDSSTGLFVWKVSNSNRIKIGDIAGTSRNDGYITITIDSNKYLAHRLAWLYVYGEFPEDLLDHVNMIRNDNRIINLRNANKSQNNMNRLLTSNNKSGYKGVRWHVKHKKWYAQIAINKRVIYLGNFDDIKDASNAYKEASIKYHGEFSKY